MRLNALDRLVHWVSPKAGMRRMQYRRAAEVMASYDGASKGRRTEGWKTRSTSANAEIGSALGTLRNRSRDLVRNNGYATAAVREISAHTIGEGIIPQARGRTEAQTRRMEDLAREWFDSTACDADGLNSFYGLQNLAMRAVVESGEAIIRRRRRRAEDGLPVPLQLQLMEGDHLDASRDGATNNGNRIIQGIEFNAIGRRVAYWLFPEHPGEAVFGRSAQSVRVPAEDVLHIYRIDRPGQVRGVPWGAPVLIRLRDFDDYADAQLLRQKIAACFSAFIYNQDPISGDSGEITLPEKLEPGLLEELPAGRRIEFANPPGPDGYGDYSLVTLHEIATGYGVPYSVLTGDLRQVNFSSGRMGWLSFHRDIGQWRWHMLIPRMCMPVWGWFQEAASVAGRVREPVSAVWTPPRREMVDPAREVPAQRDAVRSGQVTLYENIRQMGYDPDEFLREVAEGNRVMDELGIMLDSDPRKTSAAGLTQARPEGTEIPPTEPRE